MSCDSHTINPPAKMDVTIVARRTDGLVLCESWDPGVDPTADVFKLRIKATDAIKSLKSQSEDVRRLTVEVGKGIELHVLLKGLLIYAVMTNKAKMVNKKLAFIYLDEIDSSFFHHLGRTFGSDNAVNGYSTQIQSISKPFHFVSFDRPVGRIRLDYADGQSEKATKKLKSSLTELNSIMRKTMEDVMTRGDVLEEVGAKARHLKDESERFKKTSQWLNFQALLKQYAPLAVIMSVILVFVQMKFALFF